MSGTQTANGKAFEYACMLALYNALQISEDITVEDSPQMRTARKLYSNMPDDRKNKLLRAANAAAKVIIRLEPQLQYPQNNIPLYLSIQSDSKGISGDVRDVLCIRRQNLWQIGLSCKHNHHAVKHSRLSDTIDFGHEWFGIPCSRQYFSEIVPLFNELRRMRDDAKNHGTTALWADIPDKAEYYYKPVLQSFLDELSRLANSYPNIPGAMIQYLIGRYDFYKVITDDSHETTRVEAINISGTLNRPSGQHKSIVDIPRLRLPSRFYHMGFKPGSANTVEVVCDEGWTISMRMHNASARIEPSLKFDVNLISLPGSMHAQVEPW